VFTINLVIVMGDHFDIIDIIFSIIDITFDIIFSVVGGYAVMTWNLKVCDAQIEESSWILQLCSIMYPPHFFRQALPLPYISQ